MNRFAVLDKPIVSEKSGKLRENNNKYLFKTALTASKADIKRAVESIFEVKVASINSCIVRGPVKRRGVTVGKRKNYKKAYVTLEQGQKIDLFEDN